MEVHYLLHNKNCISFLILLSCILVPIYNIMFFNVYSVANIESCPLCYGTRMCHCFTNKSFELQWNHLWTNLINIYGRRLVLFGNCNGELVVIKRFSIHSTFPTYIVNITKGVVGPTEIVNAMKHLLKPQFLKTSQTFKLCPSAEKLETFLSPLKENIISDNLTEFYLNIFYTMQTNMEPVIQQVTKGWGVAEYLGGCGEIAVSKYCGETVTSIAPKLNWTERTMIAKQLLKFAFNATFDHPKFAFYFTDMSSDNFAVSSQGVVRLVDLEHVIVVDKYPEDQPDDWNIWHQSFHDDSVNGFAFSPQEICLHQTSDLNIYAICQGILSAKSDLLDGGLLHSPPQHFMDIKRLIQDCISPSEGQCRFDIAHSIINILS